MRNFSRALIPAGFALFALCASAGMMNPIPIEELSTNADVIVHGTVLSKSVERDAGGRIITRVKLQIAEVWKGQVKPEEFSIVHGGGRIGNIESRASIQMNYDIGEEVVAMLRLNQRKEGVTIGLVQGKFHVETDTATRQKFVSNVFHGRPPDPGSKATETKAAPAKITIEELKRRVRKEN